MSKAMQLKHKYLAAYNRVSAQTVLVSFIGVFKQAIYKISNTRLA